MEFEKNLNSLSKFAKKVKLNENYDWLLYESNKGQYLTANFSEGIKDILTAEDYRTAFQNQNLGIGFEKAIESIKDIGITSDKNYLKQMLPPWSTVEQISVSEFPLAHMIEYKN